MLATSPATTLLPNVATALAWRDWETGLAEAQDRRAPILALAEPAWTNSAQRLALVLGQDAALREVLEENFALVLVDPYARPDLVSRWQRVSLAIAGTGGPPLLVLLTHEGLPFLSYPTMWPEGRAPHPSLAALARATAEAYGRDPAALLAEARALNTPAAQGAAPAYRSAPEVWQGLASEIDPVYGGVREMPKHPRPQLLWLLLDLGETGDAPEAGAFVRTTLGAMLRGGIYDQLTTGFHRCSRDERWIVPHFEKLTPLNAQLASVYARAARIFADGAFLDVANDLAAFCVDLLREGVDAVAAASHFYTWTARELLDHLDPASVQAIGLHYNTVPDGSRQVLYRARDPAAMATYSSEDAETLHRRIREGRRQLRAARDQRRRPEPELLPTLSWPATTIRWLLGAAEEGCDIPVRELEGRLDRLAAGSFREELGHARPGAPEQEWLEDQAAILAAMLAAFRVTREPHWLDRARALADLILERYGLDGGWRDRPREPGSRELSRAVMDDVLPASIATVTTSLAELGALLAEDHYRERAQLGAAAHLPGPDSGWWAAAMWRAWFDVA